MVLWVHSYKSINSCLVYHIVKRKLLTGVFLPLTDFYIGQGSGTFLAERATEASYLEMGFHESHTIGHWCRTGPQNLVIRH